MKWMNVQRTCFGTVAIAGAALLLAMPFGCGDIWLNLTKEKDGTISVTFVNETTVRASFSFGAYDEWDNAPGPLDFQQSSVEAGDRADTVTVNCGRNFALATEGLLERGLLTSVDQDATFDPDRFVDVVNFSDAPGDSDAQHLPTVGTAEGLELLLGVHFSCGDEILIFFFEDPDQPGGFRVDYEVIRDEPLNEE